jgi:E3 ubiquitin-protein ligase synoviolin
MRSPVSGLTVYLVLSFAMVAGMAYDEGSRHRAFFPTVTALAANNLFHAALANGFFASLYLFGWSVTRLFLGKLNQTERVRVTEKFFVYFIDMLLGLGLFRTHLNYWAVVQVSATMVFRILHQVCSARLDTLEQAMQLSVVGLVRFAGLLLTLFYVDIALVYYFFDVGMQDGFGLSMLLCLEFMVMAISAFSVTVKLTLHQYEQFRGGIWEPRGRYRFYCDIATEAVSCLLYIGFFVVMTRYTFTPLHIIRHLVDNGARLTRAVRDCTNYRSLVAKLEKLGDPTEEELEADRNCSVCLGDIETPAGAKRLPCRHCFHSQCLTRWLERNNTCPYCRAEIEPMLTRNLGAAPHPPNAAAQQPQPPPRAVLAAVEMPAEDAIQHVYIQYLRAHRLANIAREEAHRAEGADDGAAQPAGAAGLDAAGADTRSEGSNNSPPPPTPGDHTATPFASASGDRLPGSLESSAELALQRSVESPTGSIRSQLAAYKRYHATVQKAQEQLEMDLRRVAAVERLIGDRTATA